MDNDVDYTNYDNKYKMNIRPDVLMMHMKIDGLMD